MLRPFELVANAVVDRDWPHLVVSGAIRSHAEGIPIHESGGGDRGIGTPIDDNVDGDENRQ